jgi:hypothetical protein
MHVLCNFDLASGKGNACLTALLPEAMPSTSTKIQVLLAAHNHLGAEVPLVASYHLLQITSKPHCHTKYL